MATPGRKKHTNQLQHLKAKVRKVLSSTSRLRVDSPDIVAALKGVSSLYEAERDKDTPTPLHNASIPPPHAASSSSSQSHVRTTHTQRARSNLRSILQRRAVVTNQQLVAAFSHVEEELSSLDRLVAELDNSCNRISEALSSARLSSKQLLNKTQHLQRERSVVDRRHALVTSFLSQFQLTPSEEQALTTDDINDAFFAALQRVTSMRQECKKLLSSNHQRVGLDILDSLGRRIEDAYKRLYFWVQEKSRHMNVSSPDVAPIFVKALEHLKRNPAYFEHCCQEIYQARRVLLIKQFIAALTRGGPNGVPRPIEIHAHDPVRYVSDMLAWVHQAAASEREFWTTIMNVESKGRDSAATEDSGDAKDPQADSKDSQADGGSDVSWLGQVFQGIARPLGGRVEQALYTQPTALLSYKLSNILSFYCQTVGSILPDGCRFVARIQELQKMAEQSFFDLLRNKCDALLSSALPYTHDLSPPRPIIELLDQLQQIMVVYGSSLLPDQQSSGFAPVLETVLGPLAQVVEKSAKELDPSDTAVYHLNVLHAIERAIKKFSFASTRLETVALNIHSHSRQLVMLQSASLLQRSGLGTVIQLVEQVSAEHKDDPVTNLSLRPGLEDATMANALAAFYKNLFAAGAFAMPQCDRIINPHVRAAVRKGVARVVSQKYRLLHKVVSHPANGYSTDMLQHTPEAVDTLLDF